MSPPQDDGGIRTVSMRCTNLAALRRSAVQWPPGRLLMYVLVWRTRSSSSEITTGVSIESHSAVWTLASVVVSLCRPALCQPPNTSCGGR